MVDEMKQKEVGTARFRKGTSINCSNANNLHLVDLADSKHYSMMLTDWSTKIRNGDKKKTKSGIGFGRKRVRRMSNKLLLWQTYSG